MMANILVLGNSHAAALKRSVDSFAHAVKFVGFSMGSASFKDFVSHGGGENIWISDEASEGLKSFWKILTGSDGPLYLAPFDVVVIVGFLPPYNSWSLVNCPQSCAISQSVFDGNAPVSFSAYCHISPYKEWVAEARRIVGLFQYKMANRTVVFIPSPHLRDDASDFNKDFRAPEPWQKLSAEEKLLVELNERNLYERFFSSQNINVLLPPQELVSDGNRCPAKYSLGALGSNNLHAGTPPQWGDTPKDNPENLSHKNAEFGSVWWRCVALFIEKDQIDNVYFPGSNKLFRIETVHGQYLYYDLSARCCVAANGDASIKQDLSQIYVLMATSKLKFVFMRDGRLREISLDKTSGALREAPEGAFSFRTTQTPNNNEINIFEGDCYLAAEPSGKVVLNRKEPKNWEKFILKAN